MRSASDVVSSCIGVMALPLSLLDSGVASWAFCRVVSPVELGGWRWCCQSLERQALV